MKMHHHGLASALLLALALAGCGSGEPGPTAAPETLEGSRSEEAEAVLRRLVNTDNGLEVRKWMVTDDTAVIGRALENYRAGEPLSPQRVAALRRDGFRFVRVHADQLEDLAGELGLGPVEVGAWHGQILTWRELQEQHVGPEGIAVAAGGRVRRLGPGRLRLMARSWTLQMEQGPYLNLELLPEHTRPQGARLRRLLGAQALQGDVFPSARVEALLEPGYAYILVSEAPHAQWQTDEAEPPPAPTDIGPHAAVGPGATPPETVGEFLLACRSEPPMRNALVFVPRIPARLWQPYSTAATGASPEEGLIHAGAE
ncbi:MAG: hypothetical protein ACYTGY_18465 [Planctomycetota bacterium]